MFHAIVTQANFITRNTLNHIILYLSILFKINVSLELLRIVSSSFEFYKKEYMHNLHWSRIQCYEEIELKAIYIKFKFKSYNIEIFLNGYSV